MNWRRGWTRLGRGEACWNSDMLILGRTINILQLLTRSNLTNEAVHADHGGDVPVLAVGSAHELMRGPR